MRKWTILKWIRCHLLNKHDPLYEYRKREGVTFYPCCYCELDKYKELNLCDKDATVSFSLGPIHIGWICQDCHKYMGLQ